jgi:aryl-alcohol dehydrogenase-like predicted oxidoreductase
MTMIELALAWAINHPGVTSAIIGPRTMEQLESQLPAAVDARDAPTRAGIDRASLLLPRHSILTRSWRRLPHLG